MSYCHLGSRRRMDQQRNFHRSGLNSSSGTTGTIDSERSGEVGSRIGQFGRRFGESELASIASSHEARYSRGGSGHQQAGEVFGHEEAEIGEEQGSSSPGGSEVDSSGPTETGGFNDPSENPRPRSSGSGFPRCSGSGFEDQTGNEVKQFDAFFERQTKCLIEFFAKLICLLLFKIVSLILL